MNEPAASDAHASDFVQLAAFVVGESSYALDIMRVREILRVLPIVAVREAPAFVEGVIILRGAYIPVISMRKRLGLEDRHFATGRILVTTARGRSFGLLIDSMTEVVRVRRSSLQETPMPDNSARMPLLSGLCEVRGRPLQLLNIHALIQSVPSDAQPLVPLSPL